MAEINERLEKQMEGTNLALAAVAEVLSKMDILSASSFTQNEIVTDDELLIPNEEKSI